MDDQQPDDPASLPAAPSRRRLLGSVVGAVGLGAVLALAGCGGGGEEEEEGEDEGEEDD